MISLHLLIFSKNNSDYNSKKYDLAIFAGDKLQSIYDKGIIQLNGEFEYRDNLNIFLKRGSIAEKIKMDEFYSINSAANEINSLNKLSEEEYKFLIPILLSSLDHNVIYDEYTTENMLNTQLDNINVTQGLIVAGQVIINKGELITTERYQKLLLLKQEFEGKEWSTLTYYFVLLGQILIVSLVLCILFLFIKQHNKEVLNNVTKITMILFIILTMVLLSSITLSLNTKYLYVIPFCISPIILKAFFDNRIALFTHLTTVLLIGFIVPNGFEFVFFCNLLQE